MVRSRSWLVAAIMVGACGFFAMLPRPAGAQDADTRAAARELFEEGLALAEADRWAEALSAFRRSASLVSRSSTSYNIANALYRLDRPVEALSELDEYDRMPNVRADPAARERGDTLRALVRDAVAELKITVTPPTATLFVDGWPSVLEGSERAILLNPGVHFIRVTSKGYEPHREELRVERGSQLSREVELEPRLTAAVAEPSLKVTGSTVELTATDVPLSASEPDVDDRKRFVKRPGFWVMIGVIAAAGIGAGVAVAVLRKNDAPSCGTTGDCATTQTLTVSSF